MIYPIPSSRSKIQGISKDPDWVHIGRLSFPLENMVLSVLFLQLDLDAAILDTFGKRFPESCIVPLLESVSAGPIN
jgi:hypothetical protein